MENTKTVIEACERMMLLRRSILRQCTFRHGLHLGQPEMLLYVKNNPGCSQRQMADDAGVTPASIAASFKRMENAGLIRRRSDTSDMRCNRVYITDRGEAELERCVTDMQEVNLRMLQGLETDDLLVFCKCLEQITRNLQTIKDQAEGETP